MALIAHPVPHFLLRVFADCCRSWGEVRLLVREDREFQRTVLEGYAPRWVYRNWRPTDRRFRGQRMSWLLTAMLGRHVGAGHVLVALAILVPAWLIARVVRGVSAS